jgi:hypothetical protein
MFVVAGNRADVLPVSVAAMQHGDLGEPAVHPTLAARGDENNPAIGQIAGFDVVERTVR